MVVVSIMLCSIYYVSVRFQNCHGSLFFCESLRICNKIKAEIVVLDTIVYCLTQRTHSQDGKDGTPHYSLYSRNKDMQGFKTPGPGKRIWISLSSIFYIYYVYVTCPVGD